MSVRVPIFEVNLVDEYEGKQCRSILGESNLIKSLREPRRDSHRIPKQAQISERVGAVEHVIFRILY